MNAFHVRVCCYTTGGYFCDGYILGSIGLVLPLISGPMGLGSVWQGLLGASALIGIFLGALIFGPITDRIGRQKILVFDLVVFVLASLGQLFVQGPVLLLVLRLVLGLAMGADYAIGPALLCEFVPKRRRGNLLASLNMVWTIGFVASYGAGFGIQQLAGPDAWRWMLASSAVPAVVTLLLRLGTPESPRWLMSRGRVEEARRIVHTYIGPEYEPDEADAGEPVRYRELFTSRYRSRTIFAGTFWLCQVFPYFAIGTFLPAVSHALGLGEGVLGEVLYNVLLALGAVAGFLVMDLLPRRRFVIATFAVVCLALVVLGLAPSGPLALVLPTFLVLAFVISAAADLESVYPAEVFPTEVRASGVGLAAAISRSGAALSTFVLPLVLDSSGVGGTMLLLAAVVAVGLVLSVFLAPETRHLTLTEAAAKGDRRPADAADAGR
jgi:MFS transporter, putative metabolite transport protein